MARILPSKYRYPVFFIGIAMMSVAGFLQRYAKTSIDFTVAIVAAGFLLFVASVVLP